LQKFLKIIALRLDKNSFSEQIEGKPYPVKGGNRRHREVALFTTIIEKKSTFAKRSNSGEEPLGVPSASELSSVPSVRPFVEGDIPSIGLFFESLEVKTTLPRSVHDQIDLRLYLEEEKKERLWIVERAGEIIGHILLWRIFEEDRSAQIVAAFSSLISLDETVASFQKVLSVLYTKEQFQKISLLIHPDQHFFFAVAQKLSFFLEGTLRKHLSIGEKRYDVALFSQLVDERGGVCPGGCCLESVRKQAVLDGISHVVVRAVLLRSSESNIEVLLLKKSETLPFPGLEEPPGGVVQRNETFNHALKRVVSKETGIAVTDDIHFLASFDFTTEGGQRVRECVFRVTSTCLEVTIDPTTHESYHWIPLQDLPSTPLHPDLVKVLSGCSPGVSYENQSCPALEHDATVECLRPPTPQLEEALLSGIHLDAYAAKGYSMIEPIGIVLRDGSSRIVGGIIADIEYGVLSIRRAWVNQDWRRAGWGKRMLARIEQIAREKSSLCIFATAMDWEDISFFQQSGYRIESQQTGFANSSRRYCFVKKLN